MATGWPIPLSDVNLTNLFNSTLVNHTSVRLLGLRAEGPGLWAVRVSLAFECDKVVYRR